jgi:hypothetical protein
VHIVTKQPSKLNKRVSKNSPTKIVKEGMRERGRWDRKVWGGGRASHNKKEGGE